MVRPLDYQAALPVSALRRSAGRAALWNGVPKICIGLACLIASPLMIPTMPSRNMVVLWIFIGGYGALFLACGIIFVIASAKIREGSPRWHGIVIKTAWIQIIAVFSWLICLSFNSLDVARSIGFSIIFSGFIALRQFRLIIAVNQSWRELDALA